MSLYGGTLAVRAFAEQSVFSIANTIDFVLGVELDEHLRWQPYSGLNISLDAVFAQFIWGPRGVALQVVYIW